MKEEMTLPELYFGFGDSKTGDDRSDLFHRVAVKDNRFFNSVSDQTSSRSNSTDSPLKRKSSVKPSLVDEEKGLTEMTCTRSLNTVEWKDSALTEENPSRGNMMNDNLLATWFLHSVRDQQGSVPTKSESSLMERSLTEALGQRPQFDDTPEIKDQGLQKRNSCNESMPDDDQWLQFLLVDSVSNHKVLCSKQEEVLQPETKPSLEDEGNSLVQFSVEFSDALTISDIDLEREKPCSQSATKYDELLQWLNGGLNGTKVQTTFEVQPSITEEGGKSLPEFGPQLKHASMSCVVEPTSTNSCPEEIFLDHRLLSQKFVDSVNEKKGVLPGKKKLLARKKRPVKSSSMEGEKTFDQIGLQYSRKLPRNDLMLKEKSLDRLSQCLADCADHWTLESSVAGEPSLSKLCPHSSDTPVIHNERPRKSSKSTSNVVETKNLSQKKTARKESLFLRVLRSKVRRPPLPEHIPEFKVSLPTMCTLPIVPFKDDTDIPVSVIECLQSCDQVYYFYCDRTGVTSSKKE